MESVLGRQNARGRERSHPLGLRCCRGIPAGVVGGEKGPTARPGGAARALAPSSAARTTSPPPLAPPAARAPRWRPAIGPSSCTWCARARRTGRVERRRRGSGRLFFFPWALAWRARCWGRAAVGGGEGGGRGRRGAALRGAGKGPREASACEGREGRSSRREHLRRGRGRAKRRAALFSARRRAVIAPTLFFWCGRQASVRLSLPGPSTTAVPGARRERPCGRQASWRATAR